MRVKQTVSKTHLNDWLPELAGRAADAYCKAINSKEGLVVYKWIVSQSVLRAQKIEAGFLHVGLHACAHIKTWIETQYGKILTMGVLLVTSIHNREFSEITEAGTLTVGQLGAASIAAGPDQVSVEWTDSSTRTLKLKKETKF